MILMIIQISNYPKSHILCFLLVVDCTRDHVVKLHRRVSALLQYSKKLEEQKRKKKKREEEEKRINKIK